MNNLLDILTYHKKKYEIFELLENLYKSISLSKLKNTKIKTHNLDSYSNLESCNFDVVLFHSKVIKPTIINYQDITKSFDLNNLNYDEILDANLNYLLRSNKVNKIFLFSNISIDKINNEKLVLIKIDINNDKLMYERALTMYSFVNSNLFKNNTCLIDTDVFINFEELNIFSKNFDIALTHRTKQTFMPINEGVILVKKNGISNAKEFFRNYMNIYSFISKSNYVKGKAESDGISGMAIDGTFSLTNNITLYSQLGMLLGEINDTINYTGKERKLGLGFVPIGARAKLGSVKLMGEFRISSERFVFNYWDRSYDINRVSVINSNIVTRESKLYQYGKLKGIYAQAEMSVMNIVNLGIGYQNMQGEKWDESSAEYKSGENNQTFLATIGINSSLLPKHCL